MRTVLHRNTFPCSSIFSIITHSVQTYFTECTCFSSMLVQSVLVPYMRTKVIHYFLYVGWYKQVIEEHQYPEPTVVEEALRYFT